MKIYGVGVLHSPGTRRVVHDFATGPFETSNPVLLDYAKRKGFSIGKPLENAPVKEPVKDTVKGDEAAPNTKIDEPKPKRKYEWKNPFTKKAKNGS